MVLNFPWVCVGYNVFLGFGLFLDKGSLLTLHGISWLAARAPSRYIKHTLSHAPIFSGKCVSGSKQICRQPYLDRTIKHLYLFPHYTFECLGGLGLRQLKLLCVQYLPALSCTQFLHPFLFGELSPSLADPIVKRPSSKKAFPSRLLKHSFSLGVLPPSPFLLRGSLFFFQTALTPDFFWVFPTRQTPAPSDGENFSLIPNY